MKPALIYVAIVLITANAAAAQSVQRCLDPARCTGRCREQCNAKTMAGVVSVIRSYKPGQDDKALAATLFAPDAYMAVTPISAYSSGFGAYQYLLTFSRKSAPVPAPSKFVEIKGTQLQLSASAATLVYDLVVTNLLDARYKSVFRGFTMVAFNNVSRITHITIDYPQWSESMKALNLSGTATPELTTLAKGMLCQAHNKYCTGANTQYASTAACMEFLNSISFDPPVYRLAGNNVQCRLFHALFVDLAPDVHCPHIGPTGGGKCVEDPLPYLYSAQDQNVPRFVFNSASDAVMKAYGSYLD